jgi:UDP-glucose 4-epimerase
MQSIKRGLPLPLGSIRNKRSLISLDNLVDVLILAAARAEALGQTFVVSDGEDISTTDLANGIEAALGKKGRLFSLPCGLFPLAARWAPSLKPAIERLTGSLIIDSSKFRKTMGWVPSQTVRQGIDMMAADFLRKAGHAG